MDAKQLAEQLAHEAELSLGELIARLAVRNTTDSRAAAMRLQQQEDTIRLLHAEVERLQVGEAFHAVAVQQRDEAWARIDCLISKFRAEDERKQCVISQYQVERGKLLAEVERLREAVLAAYRKGHHHTVYGGYQWCDQGGREVVEEIISEAKGE